MLKVTHRTSVTVRTNNKKNAYKLSRMNRIGYKQCFVVDFVHTVRMKSFSYKFIRIVAKKKKGDKRIRDIFGCFGYKALKTTYIWFVECRVCDTRWTKMHL